MREALATWEKLHPDNAPSDGLSFDQSIIAEASGSSANPIALWLRTCVIEIMCRQDLLGPWLQAGQPSESVFRLAATWPLPNVEQFNPQEFIDSLGAP
jgi:hypothetical protein